MMVFKNKKKYLKKLYKIYNIKLGFNYSKRCNKFDIKFIDKTSQIKKLFTE